MILESTWSVVLFCLVVLGMKLLDSSPIFVIFSFIHWDWCTRLTSSFFGQSNPCWAFTSLLEDFGGPPAFGSWNLAFLLFYYNSPLRGHPSSLVLHPKRMRGTLKINTGLHFLCLSRDITHNHSALWTTSTDFNNLNLHVFLVSFVYIPCIWTLIAPFVLLMIVFFFISKLLILVQMSSWLHHMDNFNVI